jgi:ABC-type transporter Mla subunit MlaD
MPVQDLTPQLRTRLSRVERAVGLFVSIATLLLVAGFGYYIYKTGERKGWWTFKARYYTYIDSGAGLVAGGDVRLLGFSVGRIMKVEAMQPGFSPPVFLQFYVLHPYEGYIWTDSDVKIVAGDFLGGRFVEVIPGGGSLKNNSNAVVHASYKTAESPYRIYNDDTGEYDLYTDASKGYHLLALESPAVTERLETIANQAQEALPGILDLTNRLNLVLSNVASLTLEAQSLLTNARPALTNISVITANLRDPKGSLGEWVLPTNLHSQLLRTLATANDTLTNATRTLASTDTNITGIATNLDQTLINLANITSNLNQQVQNNTNLVKSISDLIINANDMVQGLKHHWLLRSAFKNHDKEEKPKNKESVPREIPSTKAGKWR